MAGIHQQQASHMNRGRFGAATDWVLALGVLTLFVLVSAACSGDVEAEQSVSSPSTIRSSGALAYVDSDDPGPFGSPEFPSANSPTPDGLGDGPIPTTAPASATQGSDPDGLDSVDQKELGLEESDQSSLDPDDESADGQEDLALPPEGLIERPDGIELVFADGALASIAPRSTIGEIGRALGPLYIITEEPFIRAGFSGGYSVSRGGEVLFWAVEENGRITTIMATNPKVGLDSGLRPTMPLIDAVALHGEPSLRLEAELREFATFADGTGAADGVSVLVAIGQFGGPVGSYVGTLESGQESAGHELANANIKELWFDLS